MKYLQRAAVVMTTLGLLAALTGAVGAQEYPPGTLTVDGFGQYFLHFREFKNVGRVA